MNTKQTVRLLRMAFHLLKNHSDDISSSVGRDLYDYIEENTQDQTIKMQMHSARTLGYDRLKIIRYLKFRLNLEIH